MRPVPAVWALTRQGAVLGRRLAEALGGDLYVPERLAAEAGARGFAALGPAVAEAFRGYSGHVFLAAAGIAVRAAAPLLRGKDRDPAVVVADHRGRFCVSLISGHLGGANDLARRTAEILGGTAVITTATDLEEVPAADLLALESGLRIGNLAAVRDVNAALVEGRAVQVLDPCGFLALPGGTQGRFLVRRDEGEWTPGEPGLRVDWRTVPPGERALVLHPAVIFAGAGCRRGTSAAEIVGLIRRTLAGASLAEASLAGLSSIDLKADEPGLLGAARELGVGVEFFPADELAAVAVDDPSETVRRRVGTGSVCEAAARLAAGKRGRAVLVAAKARSGRATAAAALGLPC